MNRDLVIMQDQSASPQPQQNPTTAPDLTAKSNVTTPTPPNEKKITKLTLMISGSLILLFILVAFGFAFRNQIFQLLYPLPPAGAWKTEQSVKAECPANGQVTLAISFSNTEPNNAAYAMDVVATDEQTKKSVNLGTVQPGQTVTKTLNLGVNSVAAGRVKYDLKWTNKSSGTDVRYASYDATQCQGTTTPTPTPISGEPNFPSCPAGLVEVKKFGTDVFVQTGANSTLFTSKDYDFTLPNDSAKKGKLFAFQGEGHAWDSGCTAGNDNGKQNCDQNQPKEIVKFSMKNAQGAYTEIGRFVDHSPEDDKNYSYEFNFADIATTNTLRVEHTKEDPKGGINSVFVKGVICAEKTSPTTSPTPTTSVSSTPTPTTGQTHAECRSGLCVEVPGPGDNMCQSSFDCANTTSTPRPSNSPTATVTPTRTPTPTIVGAPQPTNTPTPTRTLTPTPLATVLPESGTIENTLFMMILAFMSVAGGWYLLARKI